MGSTSRLASFFFSTRIKIVKITIPKIKRPRTLQVNRLFNKSPLPKLLIANITVNIESESNVIPKKSVFSKTGAFVSFKEKYPINNKIKPIGTLMKNNKNHILVKTIIKHPKNEKIKEETQ